MKTTFRAVWDSESSHFCKSVGNNASGAEQAINSVVGPTRQFLEQHQEQRRDPRKVSGANGVSVHAQDEMCTVIHTYLPDGYARVHRDELERLCRWWIAIEESHNFTNSDAVFEPIEIEYDTDIPDNLHPDYAFAVYIAEDCCESGDWTQARKIEELNAVYICEPEGQQRRMIVSYDEIERDVAYPERFLLGSPGTAFEELHTAFAAGLRTDPADL